MRVDREAYRTLLAQQPLAGPLANVGLVSDFESGELRAEFGVGWSVSTDSLRGGRSNAVLKVIAGGAEDSEYALAITGKIADGSQTRWAGAVFSPGTAPMAATDLSSRAGISFWARGAEQTYYIMFFLQSAGFTPVVKTFETTAEWRQYSFTFADFNGSDGSDVMGVYFGAANKLGDFDLTIDTVRFE